IGFAPVGTGSLRGNQNGKTWSRLQRQRGQREQEAKSSRSIAVSRGDDLVQDAAGKPGSWKMSVDLGEAERERGWGYTQARGFELCDAVAQAGGDAVSRRGRRRPARGEGPGEGRAVAGPRSGETLGGKGSHSGRRL